MPEAATSETDCRSELEAFGKGRQILGAFVLTASILMLCAMGLQGCGGRSMEKASFADLIRDVETKSYLVRQFRAEFRKTRRSSVFNRDLKVKGVLVFQKPSSFQLCLTGDVKVEIVSDGGMIVVVHDGKDKEIYRVQGERDLSKFADPLMVLLQRLGSGGLRKFSVVSDAGDGQSMVLETDPHGQLYFERTKKVTLRFAPNGDIKSVRLLFTDGDYDETTFDSWSALGSDDPEILALNNRLKRLSSSTMLLEGRNGGAISLASKNRSPH